MGNTMEASEYNLFDLEELLLPISEAKPSGDNLRYTSVFDQIKEARRFDELIAQGEWETDIKTSDWKTVIELCRNALINRTKDLQIASWLTEALLKQYGYSGLSLGLQFTAKLLKEYWETLFPEIENGDLDYRIGPLTFLNEKLPVSAIQVPICDPTKSKGYSYFRWEESRMVGFNQGLDNERKERRQTLIDEGKVSGEEFASAVNLTPITFYRQLRQQLTQCRHDLKALDAVVNDKFTPNPPGFTQLGETIDACLHIVERTYKEKQKSEVVQQEDIEVAPKAKIENRIESLNAMDVLDVPKIDDPLLSSQKAISDISGAEKGLWKQVAEKLSSGQLKSALDQLLAAASLAPSIRKKNRYLLLVAKLCLKAERPDLAKPIVEELYKLIETLKLEQWEHPAWIADVVETLYRCLNAENQADTDRARQLFQKLCTLNITKAAAYRVD